MKSYIKDELRKTYEAGLRRTFIDIEGAQGPRVTVNGRSLLHFSSNDYLTLASDPRLIEAANAATVEFGAGSGASRLVSGNMTPHMALEERLKAFKGTEAVLLFNSGYQANTGVIPVLAGRGDDIFSDRLNHASIIDGIAISRARLSRYPHRDTGALERLLKASTARRKLIITDGVFSMDGTVAPLGDIAELAEKYGAFIYIDDAHGTGVLGAKGRGVVEEAGVDASRTLQMGTLGKALGSFGAFVAGSAGLIELIKNRARSFIFSTSLPPGACGASTAAIDIVESEPERRAAVRENAAYLRKSLLESGFETGESTTQIIPVIIGDAKRVMVMSKKLFKRGFLVQGIRPPTVAKGTERLRITTMSAHTREDINQLANALTEVFNEVTGE